MILDTTAVKQATLSNKYNYNLVTIVAYTLASYSAQKFAAGSKYSDCTTGLIVNISYYS